MKFTGINSLGSSLVSDPTPLDLSGNRTIEIRTKVFRDRRLATMTKTERVEKLATDKLLATLADEEPWTPPPDAHPEIDLVDFVEDAWRILEPSEKFVPGWHIDELCAHLQALSTNRLPERNLLINEPPGSSKSLITVVF